MICCVQEKDTSLPVEEGKVVVVPCGDLPDENGIPAAQPQQSQANESRSLSFSKLLSFRVSTLGYSGRLDATGVSTSSNSFFGSFQLFPDPLNEADMPLAVGAYEREAFQWVVEEGWA
jgi:hypothetical protein